MPRALTRIAGTAACIVAACAAQSASAAAAASIAAPSAAAASLSADAAQSASLQWNAQPAVPPASSRFSWLSRLFGGGERQQANSAARSQRSAAVASAELEVLPAFRPAVAASAAASDSASPHLTPAEIAMWLHDHRSEYEWSEMTTLPPTAGFAESEMRMRSTAHRRSAESHLPRELSRLEHAPVLPPIARSDDADASAAALLNLNDDDHLEVTAEHVAQDAQTERLLRELARRVAELEANTTHIDVAGSWIFFPANCSAVYRGAWTAEHEQEDGGFWSRLGFPASLSEPSTLTRPAGFESAEGVLMFVLRAYPTWIAPPAGDNFWSSNGGSPVLPSTARFSYVEGEMVLRDGHYAGLNDLVFLLHGLYSSHDGMVRLFANEDEVRNKEEGPYWLSRSNLQQFLLTDAEQSAPTLEQQVFLTELSYELNRTRSEVLSWHRAKSRENYRATHGEDRAITIFRHHRDLVAEARAQGRPVPEDMTPAQAEAEAQAAMAAEELEERAAKRYSDCRLGMVFQLAPLQSGVALTASPESSTLYALSEASTPDAPAASQQPLRMRPVSFAVNSPSAPSTAATSAAAATPASPPSAPFRVTTSPIIASSLPSAGSAPHDADLLQQRRLQVIERTVARHQDQLHAAEARQARGSASAASGIGLGDASLVNEASRQQQQRAQQLSMDGFLFSNASCPLAVPAVGSAASSVPPCRSCGFKLRLHATILHIEPFFAKALHYAYFQSALAIAQLVLLRRQMSASSTAATMQRVSILMVAMQALADSFFCLMHGFTAMTFDALFNSFIVTAVLEFALFSLFEMRFLLGIHQSNHAAVFAADPRAAIKLIYFKFYAVFIGVGTLVHLCPSVLPLVILAINGMWVPQIVLQAMLGVRRGLRDEYIIGTSVLRAMPALYFLVCPSNFLNHRVSLRLAFVLLAWLALQIGVLQAQRRFGARCMVPSRFLPRKYDYFREIPLSVLGPRSAAPVRHANAGARAPAMPVALPAAVAAAAGAESHAVERAPLSSRDNDSKSPEHQAVNAVQLAMSAGEASPIAAAAPAAAGNGVHVIDVSPPSAAPANPLVAAALADADDEEDENPCPICYGELELDVASGASSSPSLMLCPCDHLFHASCLRRWMTQQMRCPSCRAELPVEEDVEADDEDEGAAEGGEAQGLLQQPAHAGAHA